jgi:hypothetical protein
MTAYARTTDPPRCRCGNPCDYYGPIGMYSVACRGCNAKNATRQRISRAKRVYYRNKREVPR